MWQPGHNNNTLVQTSASLKVTGKEGDRLILDSIKTLAFWTGTHKKKMKICPKQQKNTNCTLFQTAHTIWSVLKRWIAETEKKMLLAHNANDQWEKKRQVTHHSSWLDPWSSWSSQQYSSSCVSHPSSHLQQTHQNAQNIAWFSWIHSAVCICHLQMSSWPTISDSQLSTNSDY